MKVIVISDSHGDLENFKRVIKKEGKPDMVIHLGDIIGQGDLLRQICDCPVNIVKGNCDFYSENSLTEVISVEKNKIFATHGHHYGVEWGLERLYYAAVENGCNIAMFGHTHVPEITPRGEIMIINPGSISRPRQLNHKPTYILMDIDDKGETRFSIKCI